MTSRWESSAPIRSPDADIVRLDPRFAALRHAATERILTGCGFTKGPCGSAIAPAAGERHPGRSIHRIAHRLTIHASGACCFDPAVAFLRVHRARSSLAVA
jgi:hypothetical protein